jgi:uncharacterized protein
MVLYFGAIFIGGALLAPALYQLVQSSALAHPDLARLASYPFKRYLTRMFMAIALAALWPFLRGVGIRSWRDLGLGRRPEALRDAGKGFAIGFLSLAVVAGLALGFHGRPLDSARSQADVVRHLLNAGLAAICVSVLEEVLFRGALFGGLRKVFHWIFALVVSSLIFSLLHFLQSPANPGEINGLSGFAALMNMGRGFGQPKVFLPGFLNLGLVGAILALAYQRSGALYFSMGLHGGWIFWQKSYGFLTQENPHASSWFWGGAKLIDGWATFFVLCLTLFVLWRWLKRRDQWRD